jgi:hypothetical protein
MTGLYDRFFGQLNSLVLFLALENEEIFGLLLNRHTAWIPEDKHRLIPSKLGTYEIQIAHAGFLLGYS